MTSGKTSILSLPLAPSLPEFLTPDPAVPSVESLFSLSSYSSQNATGEANTGYRPKPSLLRRSRQIKAHFCFTTPLPLTFPYAVKASEVKPRKVQGEAVGDGTVVKEGVPQKLKEEAAEETPEPNILDVEDFLATLEPDWQDPIKPIDG
ncbi:MAG: hypothetical protein CYPHOPRED_003833, partial [Cyphobasidiales sp. Tagirdzhanova-0007]